MSKAAGSAPSGYQPGSAMGDARPAPAGRAAADAALVGRISSPRDDESRESSPSTAAGQDAVSRKGASPPVGEHPLPARPASVGQPSWAEVIGTTWRLWLHRRVLRDQDARGQRRPGSRRRAGIFGLAAAAASRQSAAAWVAAQVGHSVIVSCDPVMCSALMARSFPAGDLLPLSASATDPMGSQIVVSTTALRSQFGSRLPDVYAPVVIASFGTGATRVDVRIEAPDGSQAYLVAQRADLLARVAAGQQLLRNKELHVSGSSRQAIAAGHVDPRLLLTLAALLSQEHQVYISRFGDAGPGAGPGATADVPLRMVRIAALVSAHGVRKNAYLNSALKFLRAQQQPPFQASLSVLHLRGKTVIQIHFSAPTPLGLLGAHTSP